MVIQKENEVYFGSDGAVSTKVNDEIYRIDESGKKIWIVDNDIIFCSGNMNISYKIMNQYIKEKYKSLEILKELAISYYDNNSLLEIVVGKYTNNKVIVNQLSSYNNFEIIKKVVDGSNIGLWTAGIKTKECFNVAYNQLLKSSPLHSIYQNTFDNISFEGIGGKLNVYRLDASGCNLIYENDIKEKKIKRIQLIDKHLIVAERLMGQILAGQNLVITTGDGNFLVNENGVKIQDLDLTLNTSNGNSKIVLNSTVGIKIQQFNGVSFVDNFFVGTDGRLNLVDIIASGDIEAKTLSATTQLKVGNVDIDDLITNGINTKLGAINGAVIQAETISASQIKTDELIVGNNIQMGANASISWSQVSSKPFIPQDASDVGAVADSQTAVFNALTNNGALKGLYMSNGSLYLSADYIQTGKLNTSYLGGTVITFDNDTSIDVTGTEIRVRSDQDNFMSIDRTNKRVYFYFLGDNGSARCEVRTDGFYVDNVKVGSSGATAVFA